MKKLIGLGAGGHAKVVIDIINCCGIYEIIGLTDSDSRLWGTQLQGIDILGDDNQLERFYNNGIHYAFIGLGSIGNTRPRRLLYNKASKCGFNIIDAIHPSSIISKYARIGNGPTIMAGAIINSDAVLGKNVIINTGAIIEHDCWIGDHVHIATGAKLAGGVQVGEGSHIGLGAIIRQCISIGSDALIGAGAVVIKDVTDGQIVIGNPSRLMENINGSN